MCAWVLPALSYEPRLSHCIPFVFRTNRREPELACMPACVRCVRACVRLCERVPVHLCVLFCCHCPILLSLHLVKISSLILSKCFRGRELLCEHLSQLSPGAWSPSQILCDLLSTLYKCVSQKCWSKRCLDTQSVGRPSNDNTFLLILNLNCQYSVCKPRL